MFVRILWGYGSISITWPLYFQFRIWATDILKQHLSQGYTINKERLQKNYDEFLRVVEDIKLLSQNTENVRTEDVLELIKAFSATWFGLDSYDREELWCF